MTGPDVVGLPVEDARRVLSEAGVTVFREEIAAPPRAPLTEGRWRVVQQGPSGPDGVLLVTALFPVLAPATAPSETPRD